MTDTTTKSPGLAPSDVYDIEGLAAYSDDAIVSRTLINAKSGSLTLFAFAAGQELSEHTCPYNAMVHVLEGEGQIIIDGKPFTVRANQMLLLPAGVPHAVNAVKHFKMLLTMFKTKDGE